MLERANVLDGNGRCYQCRGDFLETEVQVLIVKRGIETHFFSENNHCQQTIQSHWKLKELNKEAAGNYEVRKCDQLRRVWTDTWRKGI